MTLQEQYNALSFYTLSHQGKEFIHQYIVDAFTAQTANDNTKPIAIFFSLAGLYLFTEKKYTGKEIQHVHGIMARKTKQFVKIMLPGNRGKISVTDVLAIPPGPGRDAMIREWCASVWLAYASEHDKVIFLTDKLLSE